ncbi:MAG: hypothetical protein ACOYM3_04000 [Terrimicrobiaceae bacterium]
MKSHLILATFLLLSLSCPLMAASPEHPGAVPVLLGLDSVRKELGLSKSQCRQLDAVRADFKSDVRQVTTNTPATPVGKKAANATVEALRVKYNEKAVAILTPAQHQRLVQIEHQTLGGLMLFLPDLQKELAFTAGQVADIEKIRAEGEAFANRITGSFEKGEITLQERLDTLKNYRHKQSSKALRVLTPAQQKALENMQGNQFKPA